MRKETDLCRLKQLSFFVGTGTMMEMKFSYFTIDFIIAKSNE